MIDYFRRHLGAKLLLSYLAIIVVGVTVLIFTSQSILPASFNRHMAGMGMTPALAPGASVNEGMGMGMGGQGFGSPDTMAQLAMRFNQMAERLNQVESMRRRLIGDVSHELRTPLTAIKGSMEGLIDGVLPAANETYQQIHAEADRLNRLVDDLQELSRVEARAYELDIRPVEVSSLVRTVTKRLSPQAESKRITLDLELAPDLPHVLADEDRAVQVLTNLTGNALQYTPEGGRITITAKRIGGEVQIAVRDTGISIPPEHLSRIFDRFYRVDKSRSRQSGGGSGIGLTIARALIEAHNGRIWVESALDGNGSTFTFTLPIVEKG